MRIHYNKIDNLISRSSGYLRANLICLLIGLSFFIIGIDLSTEIAQAQEEVEYIVSVLCSATDKKETKNTKSDNVPNGNNDLILTKSDSPLNEREISCHDNPRAPPSF